MLCADIRNWMTQIKQNASSNVNKILVANKCDVDPSERVRIPYSRCYLHRNVLRIRELPYVFVISNRS